MKKYLKFITESKGISNIIKIYSEIIYNNFVDSDNKIIYLDLTDESFPLYNIKLNIIFENRIDFYAKFEPINYTFSNNILRNINLYFFVPIGTDNHIIKSKISHELTHVLEFYNLVKNQRDLPTHVNLQKIITNFNKIDTPLNDFTYFIYLSLNNELNARVSEAYHFLMNFNNKDKNFLEEKIKESESWKKYEELDSFNADYFYNYMIEKISESALIELVKYLNNQMIKNNYNLNFIDSNLPLVDYFKNWENIFKSKCIKNKKKLLSIIDEVIKDQKNMNEKYRYY